MLQRDIGSRAVVATSVSPKNSSAATTNGAVIDRLAHNDAQSAIIHHACGAASGTPTSYTVDTKLQHGDASNLSDAADVTGGALTTLTADSTEASKNLDLSGLKRYVRLVTTVAFVGGTSPAVPVVGDMVIGGQQELPAV